MQVMIEMSDDTMDSLIAAELKTQYDGVKIQYEQFGEEYDKKLMKALRRVYEFYTREELK